MELQTIANFIKKRRKELGLTQVELAQKLFVTEKAISRWETGRGTPDTSLLIPLSKELGVNVSELLNGKEDDNDKAIKKVVEYNELNKKSKHGWSFKITVINYIISIFLFLIYLRFEYNPNIELSYFIRLLIIIIASLLIIIGNVVYANNCADKIEEKNKVTKLSLIIVFIYYIIFLFNMTIFARYDSGNGYNLIPFNSIISTLKSDNLYFMIINTLGNLLIFMPLEYFIIKLFKIKKLSLNLLLSFLIILIIEILQFIFKLGIFDIDDIILNITGMIVFYIVYKKRLWNVLKIFKNKAYKNPWNSRVKFIMERVS